MNKRFNYPLKVLLAFGEAIAGKEQIQLWLKEHGYEPLAELSKAICGDRLAFEWLVENCPQYAAFDKAIDNNFEAKIWLKQHGFTFYIIFADACIGNPEAIGWFMKRDLQIFLRLANIIRKDIEQRNNKKRLF